jgi:hypothetical protein
LLDSLPDELPSGKDEEIRVIQKTSRFDIKPFLSAAALFALVFSAVFAYPKFSDSDPASDKKDNPVITESTTAGILTETPVTTATLDATIAVTTVAQKDTSAEYTENSDIQAQPVWKPDTGLPTVTDVPVQSDSVSLQEGEHTHALPVPPHEQHPDKTDHPVPPSPPEVSHPDKKPENSDLPSPPDEPEKPAPVQPPEHVHPEEPENAPQKITPHVQKDGAVCDIIHKN